MNSWWSFVFIWWRATSFSYRSSKYVFARITWLHTTSMISTLRSLSHQINWTPLLLLSLSTILSGIRNVYTRAIAIESWNWNSESTISNCRQLWWLNAHLRLFVSWLKIHIVIAQLFQISEISLSCLIVIFILIVRRTLFIVALIDRIKSIWTWNRRAKSWLDLVRNLIEQLTLKINATKNVCLSIWRSIPTLTLWKHYMIAFQVQLIWHYLGLYRKIMGCTLWVSTLHCCLSAKSWIVKWNCSAV